MLLEGGLGGGGSGPKGLAAGVPGAEGFGGAEFKVGGATELEGPGWGGKHRRLCPRKPGSRPALGFLSGTQRGRAVKPLGSLLARVQACGSAPRPDRSAPRAWCVPITHFLVLRSRGGGGSLQAPRHLPFRMSPS